MKNHTGIKDFFLFSIIAILILAFISIPYWAANSVETDEILFRGAYFDEMDYAVHLSMMQAGSMGSWVYEMRFTTEEHNPAFLRLFYIFLGHVSKWLNLSVEITYHIARWVFGFIALYSIHQLCIKVFQVRKLAWAAFLLAVLGGGAGWIQLIFNDPVLRDISPIDFWLIDAYVFFSISIFPSFSFTLALMAIALNLYLDYLTTHKWQTIFFISLLAVISQMTNPIAFAVIDIAFAGVTFFTWWKNKKIDIQHFYALEVLALVQTPLLVYNFLILNLDPLWSQFTLQNQTLSPPPSYYVWGFLPFLIFALYGTFLALREKNANMIAMSTWAISGFILAYLPVFIQRRFLLGITIPLGILAVYGLDNLVKQTSTKIPGLLKREKLVYLTYIILSSISFMNLSLGSSLYLQTHPEDNFYPRDLEAALVWLDENANPNDFALGDIKTGQLVAQRTRLKTFAGHPMETLFFDDKITIIEQYYQGDNSGNWIYGANIQWVIYGPYEKEIASSFIPTSNLELVYENKTVFIYKVKQ